MGACTATLSTCFFATVCCSFGIWMENWTYRREPFHMSTQAFAQDAVTLFWTIPVALTCRRSARHGSRIASSALLGCLLYFVYSYLLSCTLLSRNELFLIYVLAYSNALYGLLDHLRDIDIKRCRMEFLRNERWSSEKGYRRLVSWYVIIVGISTGCAWIREETKMLLGYESELLEQQSTSALPVQALDLGFLVPLHVYGGAQLMRDKPVGYLIVSMCLMLSSTLLVAVAAMAKLLRRRDLVPKEDPGSFFLTAVASIGLLLSYLWFCGKKTVAKD